MYPTISDLIYDLIGIKIPLPIQTFGFFLALSFIVVAFILAYEFKRLQNANQFPVLKRKILKGKPASIKELVITGIISFILGFKLVGVFFDYAHFNSNPQEYVFSSQGSLFGGLIIAGIAVYMIYREKDKKKLQKPVWEEEVITPKEIASSLIFIGAIYGIIGAKVFHNLEYIGDFIKDPIDALMSFSGLTYYGGLIVATIAIYFWSRKRNINFMQLANIAAPTIILAYGIGRIGCQMSGDGDWGIVNTAPIPDWLSFLPDWVWSYNYPHNVINEGIPIAGCVGNHCMQLPQPVYPTPLYETVMCFLIFGILWFLRTKIKPYGVLFSIFLIFSAIERYLIEQIRVNALYDFGFTKITQAELISVVFLILGIVGIYYFSKKKLHLKNQIKTN